MGVGLHSSGNSTCLRRSWLPAPLSTGSCRSIRNIPGIQLDMEIFRFYTAEMWRSLPHVKDSYVSNRPSVAPPGISSLKGFDRRTISILHRRQVAVLRAMSCSTLPRS